MDAPASPSPRLTYEEYLELERTSEVRHEFYQGEVWAMSGGSKNHNRLVGNLQRLIEDRFLPEGCGVFSENVKLEVIPEVYYPYPDLILTCDPGDKDDPYIARHPTLLVEVTSRRTEAADRGFKLRRYQKIPSLKYYLIVSQFDWSVDVYARQQPRQLWTYQVIDGEDAVIDLEYIDLRLPLREVYRYVVFPPPPAGAEAE